MRYFIGTALILVTLGCGATSPPQPAPMPLEMELAPPEWVPPSESTPPAVTQADQEAAAALVEEGRRVQREQGEAGAAAALELYGRALVHDGRHSPALWEMGWSHQVLEDWDSALLAWEKLAGIDSDYPELSIHFPILKMRRDRARAIADLPDPGALPPPELTPRAGPTLTFGAVGDMQMGRAWPPQIAELPPKGSQGLFERVVPLLQRPQIMFGNLETVLADEGESRKCRPGSTKCYAFRAPTSFAQGVREVGFDVVSIANNHTGDFGEAGRTATIEALDRHGLLHSGPVGDLASWEESGLRVGLVAFGTGGGLYKVQDIDTARRVVADLDRTHDIIVVSFHGGAEGSGAQRVPGAVEMFYGENRGDVRGFSRAMVDAGADLVLGHGPHVLRAMEVYRERLIAYSLGNFSAWYGFNLKGPLGRSVILHAELAPNGVLLGAQVHSVLLDGPGVPTPDPEGQGLKLIRQLSKQDFNNEIFDDSGNYRRREGPAPSPTTSAKTPDSV